MEKFVQWYWSRPGEAEQCLYAIHLHLLPPTVPSLLELCGGTHVAATTHPLAITQAITDITHNIT